MFVSDWQDYVTSVFSYSISEYLQNNETQTDHKKRLKFPAVVKKL